MSLSSTTDFNEASPVAADFNAQKIVQANSTVLSADANTLVEKALRRTRYLLNNIQKVERKQKTLNPRTIGLGSSETFTSISMVASAAAFVDFTNASVGDTIKASIVFDYTVTNSPGSFGIELATIEDYGGAGTTTAIPGAKAWIGYISADRRQAYLQGTMTVTTAGPLRIVLRASAATAMDILSNYDNGCLIAERTQLGL